MLQRQNTHHQINSRFIPGDLKIGTFVLFPTFTTQKGLSKKLQPLRKGPYQIVDKTTDVTYKLTDSNKKEFVQNRKNLFSYYPKEYALRELTQLYSLTGLKIVQNISDMGQDQNTDKNETLKPIQHKETDHQTSLKIETEISQKETKNRKMILKNLPQDQKEKFEHRELSQLRSQPRKNYKTVIPQSKILKKVEFQNNFYFN